MADGICRWGILGTATIARKNWRSIRNAENCTLSAVASRDIDRAGQFISECQSQDPFGEVPSAVAGYEQLIERDDVDAVYIPLPTALRKQWVLHAAEAGKHVTAYRSIIAEYLGAAYFEGVTLEDPSPLKFIWADACRKVVDDDMPELEMQRLLGAICNYRVYTRRLLNYSPDPIDVPVQVIRLNDYAFLALPGEVLADIL